VPPAAIWATSDRPDTGTGSARLVSETPPSLAPQQNTVPLRLVAREGRAVGVVAGHFYVERGLDALPTPRRRQPLEALRAYHPHHPIRC